jgi:hypothetical protein
MPKTLSIEEIMKKNPQVDPEKLKEGFRMLEKLRNAGVKITRHRLVPPHERKRISLERSSDRQQNDQNA